jgi:hypothetical protein
MVAKVSVCFRFPDGLEDKSKQILKFYKDVNSDSDSFGVKDIKYSLIKEGSPFYTKQKPTYQLTFRMDEGTIDEESALGHCENIIEDHPLYANFLPKGKELRGYLVKKPDSFVFKGTKAKAKAKAPGNTEKPERCPRGTNRYPPKTGVCTEKGKIPIKTRKVKKVSSPVADKAPSPVEDKAPSPVADKAPSPVASRNAALHDIANDVSPGYEDNESLTREQQNALDVQARIFLNKPENKNIQFGDIVFLGTSNDDQGEGGFRLVLDDGNTLAGEYAPYLPKNKKVLAEIQRRNIHYRPLLRKIANAKKNDDAEEMMKLYFYGNELPEDIESELEESGIL